MSHDSEKWGEHCYEDLMNDIIGRMIADDNACQRFIEWADGKYPATVQKYVNQWLAEDKDAMRWFNDTLEGMIADVPEPDIEDMPGADR